MLQTALKIVRKDDPDAIFPDTVPDKTVHGELAAVAVLEAGMQSGKSSVMLNVKLPDGSTVIVQTSSAMLLTIAAGLKGAMERFGEPWDGV